MVKLFNYSQNILQEEIVAITSYRYIHLICFCDNNKGSLHLHVIINMGEESQINFCQQADGKLAKLFSWWTFPVIRYYLYSTCGGLYVTWWPSPIGFYDSVGFTQLQVIPDYYYISFRHAAAVLCCSYVNGGQPFPHTFSSYLQRYVLDSWYCRLLSELGQWLVKWARGEDLEQTGSID